MHGWCTTPPRRDAGAPAREPTSPAESEGGQLFMKFALVGIAALVLMGGKL